MGREGAVPRRQCPAPAKSLSLLLLSLGHITAGGEDVVGAHVDMEVKVKNSTTLYVEWDSHLWSISECVLFVFVKGSKEDEIILLPRNGSLELLDRKPGTLYSISLTCFNSETFLKSSNVSIQTDVWPSSLPSTVQKTSEAKSGSSEDRHLNNAKLLSSDVLTGAVFGCIGSVILLYLSYSFYKKWRRDERLRAFLRLHRNAEVAPYFIFGDHAG
ncbi:uncharacterized protein LOC103177813 [Callorhinchus milii]|uniref:uncharacterized protein LOC103177813 n=1 Tax=Callorhinchus milii TaxID=7868 RepID=UPI00045754FB|nr:uncharacterized protein LOC103177813 [Callorhinchus milii]|eukprot:gi/632949785/ref/XP_007890354.1/ PREDICTED: uncharacterized protein LOC103177813 [Callorhinchus milii]